MKAHMMHTAAGQVDPLTAVMHLKPSVFLHRLSPSRTRSHHDHGGGGRFAVALEPPRRNWRPLRPPWGREEEGRVLHGSGRPLSGSGYLLVGEELNLAAS